MGLLSSGKTLNEGLTLLDAAWYNADKVRDMANDWDLSCRNLTSNRMKTFRFRKKMVGFICDFVVQQSRGQISMRLTIWMDTVRSLMILINYLKYPKLHITSQSGMIKSYK